jgi:hypothetical protein
LSADRKPSRLRPDDEPVGKRAWGRLLAALLVTTGMLLTILSALDLQRVCVGLMDDACGSSNRSGAITKLALAVALFALTPLIMRLSKRSPKRAIGARDP